jgi:EAL domain-containing protein (putative c-di-GMP-specific phosphodiesterase class I)
MHLSTTAPHSPNATPLTHKAGAEAPVDLAGVAQAVHSHTRFQLRQLQPTWLEACVSHHVGRLGRPDGRSYLAQLQRDPALAEQLLTLALQPPPLPADAVSLDTDLRAGTRGLLDGVARQRPAGQALDVWVLVPEGRALLAHLREHLLRQDPQCRPLRLHGPHFLVERFGSPADAAPQSEGLAAPAAASLDEASAADVRPTLRWLDAHLPEGGPPAADLIVASDLFTCWRPDLQRLWLGRLAGALRSGGLLLLGRPKALWRAPRGLRALHVDGMHWLQRSRPAQETPAAAARADLAEAAGPAADEAPATLPTRSAPSAPSATSATSTQPSDSPHPASLAADPAAAAGSAAIGAAPPALSAVGLLDIRLPERNVTLNAAMRRLLGLPTPAAGSAGPATTASIGWDDLLLRLSSADRLRLQRAAEADEAALATAAGLWTLADGSHGDPAAPTQLRMQCELLTDGQGRRRLCCLATAASAASATAATSSAAEPAPTEGAEAPASAPAPAAAAPSPPTRPGGRGSLEVVTSLPGAAARHELELLYQPQLDVSRGHLRAVEALLRWNHPQLGLVEPRAFLPWAEECGLIIEIGRWTLEQACRQARHWRDLGLPPVPMAVNVSPAQLESPQFVAQIEQALALAGLPASSLELELTESILLHESDRVRQHLAACRRLGVRIALDDFGTGQANLSRLHRLPLDKLKLDPSFIRHLNVDRGAQAIVRSMVGLGHQLGLAVVAEGVEQGQQLAQLGELRCDAYQGHLATPALGAEALTQRLLAQAAG